MMDMWDAYCQWQVDGMLWWHAHPALFIWAIIICCVFVIGGKILFERRQ